MRSDFWSLPYAARQAIQRGERAQWDADIRARTVSELEARVAELEKHLAEANATIAALRASQESAQ